MALTKITPQMFDTSATAHDLNVDNGTFVVDGSASRVGIGTSTPSTLLDVNGTATATTFVGALTGNVTGNVSGTAATVTGAAQTNITSVGTLSSLTVSGALNGTLSTAAQPNITQVGSLTLPTLLTITASANNQGTVLFTEAGSNKFNVSHVGSSDKFQIYNYNTSSAALEIASNGNITVAGSLTAQNVIDISTDSTIQTTSARQWATIKNTGTGTGDYSEMRISNDNNDYIIMGSIGSGYTNANWASSSYIYANRELRIKSQQGIRFYSGGFDTNTHDYMVLDSTGKLGLGHVSTLSSTLNVNTEISVGPDSNNRGIINYSSNILSFGTRQSSTNYFNTVKITSGHVGISTTPTVWSSGYISMQIGDRGFVAAHTGSDLYVGQNAYIDSAWKYEASVAASVTQHSGGQITHKVAAAGTAGNTITWTDALHIKTNGNIGIHNTNPTYLLDMQGAIGDGTPMIRGTITGTPANGFNWATEFMSANLAAGRRVVHVFGRARAVNAAGHISYYESTVDDNNNQVQIGMYGANDIINATYDRRVGINTGVPVSDLFVANRTEGAWRTSHGGTRLYVKNSGTSLDPQVYSADPQGIVVSVNSSNTTGPDKHGLVLYNDDASAGGFSPMLTFAKSESGSSPYKATMAAIYARAPSGTGNRDAWIDGELIFATSGAATSGATAQMVLDKEGRLYLGKANLANRTVGYAGQYWDTDGTSYYTKSSGNGMHFYDTSNYKFYVNANGGIYNYSGNNVNLSDERVKKNIEPLESQWAKVKLWNLKKFHLKTDDDSDSKRYGVIAQDVEIHNPEAVDEFMHSDTETRKAVKEQQLTWLAIKALQEAMERIETLEAEVKVLKGE